MRNSTLKTFVINSQAVRYTLLFLLFFTSNAVFAQHFHSTSPYLQGTQVQAEQYHGPSAAMYQSTVYTPFSNETPSNSDNGITGRKNEAINPGNEGEWGGNSDGGDQENSFPIGEPWIMLAFAVMAAVVITLRKKQTA